MVSFEQEPMAWPQALWDAFAAWYRRVQPTQSDRGLALLYDFLSSTWRSAPPAAACEFLVQAGLHTRSPAFWGLYLDVMLAARGPRATLQAIRGELGQLAQPAWAEVTEPRLHAAQVRLGVQRSPALAELGATAWQRQLARPFPPQPQNLQH